MSEKQVGGSKRRVLCCAHVAAYYAHEFEELRGSFCKDLLRINSAVTRGSGAEYAMKWAKDLRYAKKAVVEHLMAGGAE